MQSPAPGAGPTVRAPAPHSCRYCCGTLPGDRSITFCPHCGQDLTVRQCPACSTELDATWRFCVACGRAMATELNGSLLP